MQKLFQETTDPDNFACLLTVFKTTLKASKDCLMMMKAAYQ